MSESKDSTFLKEQFMHVMRAFDAKPDGRKPEGVKLEQVDRVLDQLNGGDGYTRAVSHAAFRSVFLNLVDAQKIEYTSDRFLRLLPGS